MSSATLRQVCTNTAYIHPTQRRDLTGSSLGETAVGTDCVVVGSPRGELRTSVRERDDDTGIEKFVGQPANDIGERFHRTMQDEFYSIAFRQRAVHHAGNCRPTWTASQAAGIQ